MRWQYLVLGLFSITAFAQDRAAISGTVTDPSGSLVVAAAVELKSDATGLHRAATVTGPSDMRPHTPSSFPRKRESSVFNEY